MKILKLKLLIWLTSIMEIENWFWKIDLLIIEGKTDAEDFTFISNEKTFDYWHG